MTVEAILFDMDGVVVDSMPSHADAWKRVLGEFGLELDDLDIFRREGMTGRQSVADIFLEKKRPVPGESEFDELLAKKHIIFEQSRISLFPLIEEILKWVGSMGIRTALVTGSLRRSVDHVLPEEVLSRFDAVITAEDVERGKPDPEPYTRALASLGAGPERSLVIENSPMGIRSARAAGITCFALETTLPGRYLIEADRIFSGHRDLLEFLKSNTRLNRH
jgi:beta-phosphoglucomutase